MTLLIGEVGEKEITLSADDCVYDEDSSFKISVGNKKLEKVSRNFGYAFSGSWNNLLILRQYVGSSSLDANCPSAADSYKERELYDAFCKRPEFGEMDKDFELLVACWGDLWEVNHHGYIAKVSPYAALGTGQDYARGLLDVQKYMRTDTPLGMGVIEQASEKYCFVGKPHCITLERK